MNKCSICNKNLAIIYTTKLDGDKNTTMGFCFSCAKRANLPMLDDMLEKMKSIPPFDQMDIEDADDLEEIDQFYNEALENLGDISGDEIIKMAHAFVGDEETIEKIKNLDPDTLSKLLKTSMESMGLDESLGKNLLNNLKEAQSQGIIELGEDLDLFDEDDDLEELEDDSSEEPEGEEDVKKSENAKEPKKSADMNRLFVDFMDKIEKNLKNRDASKKNSEEKGEKENIFGNENTHTHDAAENEGNSNTGKSPKLPPHRKKRKYLERYAKYMFDKIEHHEIDKVVGRTKELERIMNILCRRTKNNPVLVGEPGVGKTSVADALALKIYNKEVPEILADKEIYELDITSLVAGTQLRGQFENKIMEIVKEVKREGNIILVIDEIHKMIGAGDPSGGTMDAANILKPALSRGEIQIIGTTTLEEYRKHIEKDAALERRFQPVKIDEPSVEESVEILKGIRHYYEDFHNVKISDDAIEHAVILSARYVPDRFLPDKAIDVLDEACAMLNIHNPSRPSLKKFEAELAKVVEAKENASLNDEFEKAANLKTQELELNEKIEEFKKVGSGVELTLNDIGKVIESWTKIPVTKITQEEAQKLLNLEQSLFKSIIGQKEAVEAVSRAIRRNRAGFRVKKRPASFIFVGPTGVGKTELAKKLALEVFGSEDNMIRLDMSEYMEKHTVSKMIGAPPGYVGFDDGGQLTKQIRRKPYSVILLDEIEKAHPDVFNMLLQILDDGRLTDSKGQIVHFENAIIIMTSNIGSDEKTASIGFSDDINANYKQKINSALKMHFRPEFLNRVDEIVNFGYLSKEEIRQIVDTQLEEVYKEAKEQNIELDISDDVRNYIAQKGYDEKYGARPIKREIRRIVEDEVAERVLKGEIKRKNKVFITMAPERMNLVFQVKNI